MVYALAGHVPPLVYRSSDKTVEKLDSPGYCLGIFEKGQYADSSIQISPGDRLFVFTDGIYEASPDDRSVFGHRLPRLLEECANLSNEEFMDRLETSLLAFLGSGDAEDDYTLLSIQSQSSAKSKRDSEN